MLNDNRTLKYEKLPESGVSDKGKGPIFAVFGLHSNLLITAWFLLPIALVNGVLQKTYVSAS